MAYLYQFSLDNLANLTREKLKLITVIPDGLVSILLKDLSDVSIVIDHLNGQFYISKSGYYLTPDQIKSIDNQLSVFKYTWQEIQKLLQQIQVLNTQITGMVKAVDIADVVRTGDIADVVRTVDIANVVRAGDIANVVRAGDIADMVRAGDIADVVRQANITDVVRQANITDVVRTTGEKSLDQRINSLTQYFHERINIRIVELFVPGEKQNDILEQIKEDPLNQDLLRTNIIDQRLYSIITQYINTAKEEINQRIDGARQGVSDDLNQRIQTLESTFNQRIENIKNDLNQHIQTLESTIDQRIDAEKKEVYQRIEKNYVSTTAFNKEISQLKALIKEIISPTPMTKEIKEKFSNSFKDRDKVLDVQCKLFFDEIFLLLNRNLEFCDDGLSFYFFNIRKIRLHLDFLSIGLDNDFFHLTIKYVDLKMNPSGVDKEIDIEISKYINKKKEDVKDLVDHIGAVIFMSQLNYYYILGKSQNKKPICLISIKNGKILKNLHMNGVEISLVNNKKSISINNAENKTIYEEYLKCINDHFDGVCQLSIEKMKNIGLINVQGGRYSATILNNSEHISFGYHYIFGNKARKLDMFIQGRMRGLFGTNEDEKELIVSAIKKLMNVDMIQKLNDLEIWIDVV